MDYSQIYANFIVDRRRREKALAGYTERHHIRPRSLGGTDEPTNLIRLVPEDHFFAHLLLAKIHGGYMWAPVAFMLGGDRRGWKARRSRRAYGWAVRAMAEARRGDGAHQFDWTIYRLRHDELGSWSGRQSEMRAIGLSKSLANMLVKGRVKAARGWYFEGKRPEWLRPGGRPGTMHSMADHRRYRFRHVDGRTFEGTQIEFRAATGVSKPGCTRLVNRQQTISRGWHLDGVEPKRKGRAAAYTR